MDMKAKIVMTAAALWVAIQLTGAFNSFMGFDFGQSLVGSLMSAGVLAIVYIYAVKYTKKHADDIEG